VFTARYGLGILLYILPLFLVFDGLVMEKTFMTRTCFSSVRSVSLAKTELLFQYCLT